jgi:hypothetical protein
LHAHHFRTNIITYILLKNIALHQALLLIITDYYLLLLSSLWNSGTPVGTVVGTVAWYGMVQWYGAMQH